MSVVLRSTLSRVAGATLIALGLLAGHGVSSAQTAGLAASATQAPEIATFAALVKKAGLESAVTGDVTVFAPSDDAFKAVPAAALQKLSDDPEALKAVLSFHVVAGKKVSSAITGNSTPASLQGGKLNLSRAGDFLTVEDALVTRVDVPAGAGVIHVIDKVLMPPVKK